MKEMTARTNQDQPILSRRSMLARCGMGFGVVGLAGLLADEGLLKAASVADRALNPMAPRAAVDTEVGTGHLPSHWAI